MLEVLFLSLIHKNFGRHGIFNGNYMPIQPCNITKVRFYLFNLVMTLCISIQEILVFGEGPLRGEKSTGIYIDINKRIS